LVFQIVDFSSIKDLKFTYMHLQFQKMFRAYTPDPHDKGEGENEGERKGKDSNGKESKEGEGREGEGREGRDGMG
jgi:hypothetical protein